MQAAIFCLLLDGNWDRKENGVARKVVAAGAIAPSALLVVGLANRGASFGSVAWLSSRQAHGQGVVERNVPHPRLSFVGAAAAR